MTVGEFVQRYQFLREPGRRLTEAYEKGNRWFDQLKELVLIEHGLVFTSEMFHQTAHEFPQEFDKVGDILHQRHIIQDYGATPEFPGVGSEMEDIFQLALDVLADIENELSSMIRTCEENRTPALARQFEELEVINSKKYEKYLLAWDMYERADSPTSFDNWVQKLNSESSYEAGEEDD